MKNKIQMLAAMAAMAVALQPKKMPPPILRRPTRRDIGTPIGAFAKDGVPFEDSRGRRYVRLGGTIRRA